MELCCYVVGWDNTHLWQWSWNMSDKKALLHFASGQNLCIVKLWTRRHLGIAKASTVYKGCETHHHSTLMQFLIRYYATQILILYFRLTEMSFLLTSLLLSSGMFAITSARITAGASCDSLALCRISWLASCTFILASSGRWLCSVVTLKRKKNNKYCICCNFLVSAANAWIACMTYVL